MGEEGVHGVADEVDRRLVSRADDEEERVDEFVLGEARAFLVPCCDQSTRQIVSGLLPLGLDEPGQQGVDLLPGGEGLFGCDGGVHDLTDQPRRVRPALGGNPEELADDLHGQGVCVGRPEVHRAFGGPLRHRVEEAGTDLLDAGGQRVGAALGEGRGDEFAQTPVVGTVGGEHVGHTHPGVDPGLPELPLDPGGPVLVGVLGHPVVGEQLLEHLVPGRRPGRDSAGQFDPRGGALGAEGVRLPVDVAPCGVDHDGVLSHG